MGQAPDMRAENFFHGWVVHGSTSLSNGEVEAGGFECRTWTSAYGTWHQRLQRLRRNPGLDIIVKNGIGDQLAEKKGSDWPEKHNIV